MKTEGVRELLHLTQEGFADWLGVSVRKVQNWDSRQSWPEWADALIRKYVIPLEQVRREWYGLPAEVRGDMPFSEEVFADPEGVERKQLLAWECGVYQGNVLYVLLEDERYHVYQKDQSGGWVYRPFGVPETVFVSGIRSGNVMFR